MLIRALRGENFMKFQRLALENLPRRGLIGIEGRNEGGKTSIGEMIQFALFGKSPTSEESSVLELIRWGEEHCTVELDFETSDGSYRVWREVDRFGTNYARLLQEPGTPAEHEVAAGGLQVQRALTGLLRFSYEDFGRSFYLAEQDAPRSPDTMRGWLDRMLGISDLLEVAGEVRQEIADLEEDFGRLQGSVKRNALQIEKYLPNVARLPEVLEQRTQHAHEVARLQAADVPLRQEQEAIEQLLARRGALQARLARLATVPLALLPETVEKLQRGYPGGDRFDDGSARRGHGAGANVSTESGSGATVAAALEASRAELDQAGVGLAGVARLVDSAQRLREAAEATAADLRAQLAARGPLTFAARQAVEEQRARRARRRGRGLRIVGWLLIIGALLGGALVFDLERAAPWSTAWWVVPEASRRLVSLGIGAGALVMLFTGFGLLAAGRGRRREARAADEACCDLAGEAQRAEFQLAELALPPEASAPLVESVAPLVSGTPPPALAGALADHQQEWCAVLGEIADFPAFVETLVAAEKSVGQRLQQVLRETKKRLQKAAEVQKKEQSRRDRAESEAHEYRKQEGRMLELEEQNRGLRAEADGLRGEIENRQLLLQMLGETADSIRHRAGPALGRSMRKLLPFLTGGRYSDIKITTDFRLQVFASEKSDFLQPQELSGGTFEALSLGFRLAFSQAFVCAVVRDPQFIFFDEPFKAMDRQRIHQTLSVLTQLSDELCQLFVVLPGIQTEDRALFDHVITTVVGQRELLVPEDAVPATRPGGPGAGRLAARPSAIAPPTAGSRSPGAAHMRRPTGVPSGVEEPSAEEPSAEEPLEREKVPPAQAPPGIQPTREGAAFEPDPWLETQAWELEDRDPEARERGARDPDTRGPAPGSDS